QYCYFNCVINEELNAAANPAIHIESDHEQYFPNKGIQPLHPKYLILNKSPHYANLAFVLLAIRTSISITGTSVRTPTVVASAAGLVVPKSAIATATASSKKFDAPIIP